MTTGTAEAIRIALGRFAVVRNPLRRVLLAVSGGPDSLALLLACAGRPSPLEVAVATVDHGLRAGSAGEADFVAAICRDLGLPHRTLRWHDAASARGNLMEAAREARYRLLAGEAARIGADALLAAHHADDQVETHLLARARGAAGAHLAGMRAWRDLEPGLVLLRPFLDLPKRALEDAVEREGLVPVRDSTNTDERFHRARVRRELADGAHDGRALAEAIAAAGRLRDGEDMALASAIHRACREGRLRVDGTGAATFRPDGEPEALWSRLLTAVGAGARPPEAAAVRRLVTELSAGNRSAATLGGCRVERGGGRFASCANSAAWGRKRWRSAPAKRRASTAASTWPVPFPRAPRASCRSAASGAETSRSAPSRSASTAAARWWACIRPWPNGSPAAHPWRCGSGSGGGSGRICRVRHRTD